MPNGPQKLILIRAGRYDYAEIELGGTLQIVGPNNTGKTTLINTLQFLYLDDRRHMDFGHSSEETREYYFPNQYSYVLFECLGARGKFVLGWRGQSKAAGGEPERFHYEGAYDAADFLTEKDEVREPKAVGARLGLKQYTVLKSAQEHRELLLQPTRGEGRGLGIVALRDNDKYPQFRETLKNLLCLSSISQDQMRDRLLMLAGLSTEKCALDVRELFGEEYERSLQRKHKLVRFKKHQAEVEGLLDQHALRETVRGELVYRWTDLRARQQEFEISHVQRLNQFVQLDAAAALEIQLHSDEVRDRRAELSAFSEVKGGLQSQLDQVARQAAEFRDFIEDMERAALKNARDEAARLERELADADKESRSKAEQKIQFYGEQVDNKRRTIANFDQALVTWLRKEFGDEELTVLARIFNFDLLQEPVAEGGITIHRREEFVNLLRATLRRVKANTYRDDLLELPLPSTQRSLAELADPNAIREKLAEDSETLERWKKILKAIVERESLETRLRERRLYVDGSATTEGAANRLFRYEQFLKSRAEEPRPKAELKKVNESLAAASERIDKLEKKIRDAQAEQQRAHQGKVAEENQYNRVRNEFEQCIFPETSAKPVVPAEAVPDDFPGAVGLFLRAQKREAELDQRIQESFRRVETALGADIAGQSEADTIHQLREELEALPEAEQTLSRDWEHQFHQLRATFDGVLRSLGDVKSAADRLNRALAGIQVSNLQALRMDVVDQTDLVASLRKLANVEQPGLFDDSSGLEATLSGFQRKFEGNPLLRYADLFTLRFTVTGDDAKPRHYQDFKQVESHGTTITIKVLFNLLVLRSLLREDASKSLLCEVPFFLDEIHSLDPVNRRAVLTTARKLGFIAITAAPESVSEVEALYFLQPQEGRIVLRHRHRIGVKARAAARA